MFLVNCRAPVYDRRLYDCDYERSGCPLIDTLCYIGPYTLFAENKKTEVARNFEFFGFSIAAPLFNTNNMLTSLRKLHMCGDRNQIVLSF